MLRSASCGDRRAWQPCRERPTLARPAQRAEHNQLAFHRRTFLAGGLAHDLARRAQTLAASDGAHSAAPTNGDDCNAARRTEALIAQLHRPDAKLHRPNASARAARTIATVLTHAASI